MEKIKRSDSTQRSKVKSIYFKAKFNCCVKRLESKKQRTTDIFAH